MGHDHLISIDYSALPSTAFEMDLRLYVERGIQPCEFLHSLLCGNAMAAMSAAPGEASKIGDWLLFLRRKLPAVMHGHPSLVSRWMTLHRDPSSRVAVPTFADFPIDDPTIKMAA